MKKLHLIRHAKSSWSDGSLADIERPLNKRGLKSCEVMAEQIVKAGCAFEHVFCSPALRAQSTIENLCAQLTTKEISWQIDQALYTFEVRDLLAWCQSLDDSLTEVVVVGHNSALTDLINMVGDQPLENLPTCGYVQLALGDRTWKDLSTGSTELLSFLKPKMFM
ncbi:MAG: histidine phosphatase family protein [Cyanobacteria bacterium P01_F01_bin.53]